MLGARLFKSYFKVTLLYLGFSNFNSTLNSWPNNNDTKSAAPSASVGPSDSFNPSILKSFIALFISL